MRYTDTKDVEEWANFVYEQLPIILTAWEASV